MRCARGNLKPPRSPFWDIGCLCDRPLSGTIPQKMVMDLSGVSLALMFQRSDYQIIRCVMANVSRVTLELSLYGQSSHADIMILGLASIVRPMRRTRSHTIDEVIFCVCYSPRLTPFHPFDPGKTSLSSIFAL